MEIKDLFDYMQTQFDYQRTHNEASMKAHGKTNVHLAELNSKVATNVSEIGTLKEVKSGSRLKAIERALKDSNNWKVWILKYGMQSLMYGAAVLIVAVLINAGILTLPK